MKIFKQNNLIRIIENNEIINIVNNNVDDDIYTILTEKDGTIHYCSSNLRKFKIIKPTINKISECVNDKDYKIIRKMMLKVLFTNKQIIDNIIINTRYYNIKISPILDINSNIKYLLFNLYDITKNKKINEEIEELKKKLQESNSIKSIFLSNISHELRTPMNSIIGFSDILLKNNNLTREFLDKFLKSINSNAKHLDELLNNILDYSRIESNDFDILYENFSISDLFDELLDVFDDVNYKKNLNFVKLQFIISEDKKIISDYLRLKQILYNLISNSIKFTNNGYIKISFDTYDNFITFKIEDTGIGIPSDKFKYVFERFWQCDSSSTKKYKGTGLGLSISKSITEMLGGEIWFESILNKGTTFFIKIPLEEIKQDILINNINKINFSGKTILIVDELPINYSLLCMYLRTLNINVLSTYNEKSIINYFNKQKDKIDIVIIDLSLPDVNVSNLINKIKKLKNNCNIITKSGLKNSQIEIENKNYINFHIEKPINKEKLLLILNKIW